MEPRTKGAIAATILIIAIPAALATFLTEVDPGYYRPIDVRTQDGQISDVPQTNVSVYCGHQYGRVRIDALIPTAYIDRLDEPGLKDLNNKICGAANTALNKAIHGDSVE